ncbi:MAG TPA: formylglycine-generating enzyme family protein [Pseudolysinimonas sp.]|jgi:formylglycine-generating enzyme required for sulfatase activity|nr:formylglycine-generating enzyme family protein [Pseudolysinimonas sp.]
MIIDRVELPGGAFRMGSDAFYPEEGPVHEMHVAAFALGRYAVTNRQFAAFVEDTGYVTVAEQPLDPALFPQVQPDALEPGSLVFTPTEGPVDLRDWRQWWRWVPGASWRTPRGPGSGIDALEDHPVVQVAYDDAVAFAQWAGGRLPTEVEWEYAARGGLDGATYAWGDEGNDGTRANTWQGRFPYEHQRVSDGVYTMPVGSFPANGFGLHEMTGNTWEWTSTPWSARHPVEAHCAPGHDHGHAPQAPERVLKGGSHLCSPEYCLRYRPAARSAQTEDSAATHLGFRVAFDA